MPDPDKKQTEKKDASNVVPATEVATNPNPRANENIRDKITRTDGQNEPGTQVGSEITDGEDA